MGEVCLGDEDIVPWFGVQGDGSGSSEPLIVVDDLNSLNNSRPLFSPPRNTRRYHVRRSDTLASAPRFRPFFPCLSLSLPSGDTVHFTLQAVPSNCKITYEEKL